MNEVKRINYITINSPRVNPHYVNRLLVYDASRDIWAMGSFTYNESKIQYYIDNGLIAPAIDTLINF